jgi:hypothetical protein
VAGLILEDTDQLPISLHLMRELRNPLLYLVPVIVLLDKDRKDDASVLASHYGFEVLTKPLSRVLMVQAFSAFVKKFQSNTGQRFSTILKEFSVTDHANRCRLLDSLATDPLAVHRANCAKAADILSGDDALNEGNQGKKTSSSAMKVAESELLRHAKIFPRHVLAFLLLGGLYAEWAMPVLARRIYQAASVAAPGFSLCHASLAQMHLLLGENDDAIANIRKLLQVGFMPDETSFTLAKILFSAGRLDDAGRVLQGQAGRFNALRSAWMEAK